MTTTKVLWHDEDDDKTYDIEKVKNSHKKLIRKNKNLSSALRDNMDIKSSNFSNWAKKEKSPKMNRTDKLLSTSINASSKNKRPKTIKKVLKVSKEGQCNCVVQSIDFSEESRRVFYGGFDKRIRILTLDKESHKGYFTEKSIYLDNIPILSIHMKSTEEIIVIGRRKKFISFINLRDMSNKTLFIGESRSEDIIFAKKDPGNKLLLVCTKNEYAIIDLEEKMTVGYHQFSNEISAITFLGREMFVIGSKSQSLFIYSTSNIRTPLKRLDLTHSVVSGNSRYLVVGCKNGFVKIISLMEDYRQIKCLQNLTTEITSIVCNEQFLVFGSRWKPNSARLVYLNELTVEKNWPNIKTNLGTISCIHLCSNNKLIIGNSAGFIHLYNIE